MTKKTNKTGLLAAALLTVFAVAFACAFTCAALAPFANAAVYAAAGGALTLKPGDKALVNSHQIVLNKIDTDANGAVEAVFSVYDTQGNKVQTVYLTEAGAASAPTANADNAPNAAAAQAVQARTPSEYDAQTFTVKVAEIDSAAGGGSGQARIIVSTPAPVSASATKTVRNANEEANAAASGAAASGAGGGGKSVRVKTSEEAVTATTTTKETEEANGIAQAMANGGGALTIQLRKGWNMISNPFQGAGLKTNCERKTLWNYNAFAGGYERPGFLGEAVLEQGKGYWVNVNSNCVVILKFAPGNYYAKYLLDGLAMHAGWNQIGAPSETTDLSAVSGNCEIKSAWSYEAGTGGEAGRYVKAQKLEPGEGYFVRVAGDCTMGPRQNSEPEIPALPQD
jgi:hypothetical protein